MIKLLLALLLGFVSLAARADYPADNSGLRWYGGVVNTGWYRTAGEACNAADAYYKTKVTSTVYANNGPIVQIASGGNVCVYGNGTNKGSTYIAVTSKVSKCVYGGTLSADGQTCVGAEMPGGTPDPCADKNEFIRRWDYPGSGVTPAPDHYDQCVISPLKMLVCRVDPANGVKFCMWLVKRTGEKYTGPSDGGGGSGSSAPDKPDVPPVQSPPIKPPPAPPGGKSCPEGSVQAGSSSDGTPICMGTGSNPPNTPAPRPKVESEKNEQLPDGSTQNTKTTTTTNSDGSTTTNTTVTVTRPDGSKETSGGTVTSGNTAGLPGKADTPENDKYDLCKQNPHLSVCRESSVSGSCGEITCVGDAIQCSTLRAAAAMECRDKQNLEALEASPLLTAGNKILDGSDTTAADFVKGTSVDMSKQTLDQSGFVTGTCLANRSFSVGGRPVEISFARVCESIQPLRAVVMACAFIISYLIVSRSVIQG